MASLEAAVAKSLTCPICLELLTSPKILSCGHTFCAPCVTRLCNSRGDDDTISCPVCRKTTVVKQGDVAQLQTNQQVKSLVDDVANARQLCNNCDSEEEAEAVIFCQDCKMYMCCKCQEKHAEWKGNIDHCVSTVDDIKQGKVTLKTFCQEHEQGEKEQECADVCIECNKIICMRCRAFVHEKKGHVVQSFVKYTTEIEDQIQDLAYWAGNKATSFKKHSAFIDEQKKRVTDHIRKHKTDIEKIHQESVRRLGERKDNLMKQVDLLQDKFLADLDKMKSESEGIVGSIESACELMENSLRAPLEGNIVAIRHSLSDKTIDILNNHSTCYKDAAVVTGQAEKIEFEQNNGVTEFDLGQIINSNEWKLKTEVSLSVEDSMNAVCATSDGRMAVCCNTGGVELYNSGGQLQEKVLDRVGVRSLGALSDGRYVVINTNNTISMYSTRWRIRDVTFETLSHDEGGYANVTVNRDDLIYVSYRKQEKIQVFKPAGGKAINEIRCDGYEPQQIFALKSKGELMVRSANTVRLINADSGAVKGKIFKKGLYPHPALCCDDSIIIAWVKHDKELVTIDQYTSELKYGRTLINDFKIDKSARGWNYLQVFLSGEIAFCTADKLYIFH